MSIPRLQRFACLLLPALLAVASAQAFELVEGREFRGLLGPEIRDPESAGIGGTIMDHDYEGLFGGVGRLHSALGSTATVVVVRDPQCPVSRRYGPRVADMARRYEQDGVRFVFLYLNNDIPPTTLLIDANRLAAPGAYVARGGYAIAEQLGVESAGDVFVLGAKGTLRYRGAVDDQFGLGFTKQLPTRNYLRDAVESVLAGQPVEVPATSAPGCWIDADPEKDRTFQVLPDDGFLSNDPFLNGFGTII